MQQRLLLLGMLAALLLLIAPLSAQAQDSTLTTAEMSASYRYGDSVTFHITADTPTLIVHARLVVEAGGDTAPYSESPAIAPDTHVDLALDVPVASLGLPPVATLSYRWEFEDGAGLTYQTNVQEIDYEDTSVPWAWVARSHSGVTVYTNGADEVASEAALELAVSALAQSRRTLGVTQPEQITVYVYPDLASLANSLRLHNRRVQDWVAAYAIPGQRVALVAAEPGPDMLRNLRRDLPHEISHLVVGSAASSHAADVPGWLNEGLALMSISEPDPVLRATMDTAVRENTLIPLETLCANNYRSLPPQDAALAYAQSESIVRYISARYGIAQVRQLLEGYADGLSCEGGIKQALGIPLAVLETQWHNDLLSQAARTPRQNTSLVPWIIGTVVSIALAMLFIAPQPDRVKAQPAPSVR